MRVLLLTWWVAVWVGGSAAGAWAKDVEVRDHWDFYFARINDADASVLLNLGLKEHAPIKSEPTLCWVLLTMERPGANKTGDADEVAKMQLAEREVTDRLSSVLKARNVARIRGQGLWQLYFYAPNDKNLEDEVKRALARTKRKKFEVGSKPDPTWKYYREFLYPSDERLQWIHNRRGVERLQKSGDVLVTPREVIHGAYFPNETKRKAFEAKVAEQKFVVDERVAVQDDKRPYLLRVRRKDPVTLDHLHRVVEYLRATAALFGGEYDDWESPVVTTPPPKKTPKTDKPPTKGTK